jgi:hypothetical protein
MCGFNILASKIASIFLGVCLLFTLWWAKNWLTRAIGIIFIGLIGTWRWTEVFCLVHWVSEILTPDIRVPLKFEYFLWLTDL